MKKLTFLLLTTLLISCDKQPIIKSDNIIKNIDTIKCSNLIGTWFCTNYDTIIKDSIVLEVDYYGIRDNKSYVQYKCNIQEFDTLLWHYCPYDFPWDDDLHIVYNNKELVFRYFH